jgi:hypothetical protein
LLNTAVQAARPIGDGRSVKVVDRLVIHGTPISFRELCRRAVPEATRYLVLDLDRTVHLERNMGELFGWELCAFSGYGLDRLIEVEPRRSLSRMFFDWSRPSAMLRYLGATARTWALPGLFYLAFGKLPARFERARRLSYWLFGPDPVSAVQRVPQLVLMHQMSRIPAATQRKLARRVWERFREDQVIERDDLAWLRSRCPNIRIVIASASPPPIVEIAAEALGVDDIVCSSIEERDGAFSSPYQLSRWLQPGRPHRISGPGQVRINSAIGKMEALRDRYPDIFGPGVVSVGISDTGYGEDHCWAEYLTRVIDINSPDPFPPIVNVSSPLLEIHSAKVLTSCECVRRAAGEPEYVDPRRRQPSPRGVSIGVAELMRSVGHLVAEIETLAHSFDVQARSLSTQRRLVVEGCEKAEARMDALAAVYNETAEPERRPVLAHLRSEVRAWRASQRRLARLERPLSRIACRRSFLLAAARECAGTCC